MHKIDRYANNRFTRIIILLLYIDHNIQFQHRSRRASVTNRRIKCITFRDCNFPSAHIIITVAMAHARFHIFHTNYVYLRDARFEVR
jgi:hypothetical protein